MLIVMSDLHLAEFKSYQLGETHFNNNLPASAYASFFNEIAEAVDDAGLRQIDLVLAGDIFELTRSGLWLRDNLRPYIDNGEVSPGSPEEQRVLEILDAIAADERVDPTLTIFRGLEELFQLPVLRHYIPGNHDRLANSTAAIRRKVQELLGIPVDGMTFAHQYIHNVEGVDQVLVRHGHEYDPSNFSENLRLQPTIPTFIADSAYDKAATGDIITVEVAAKLPYLFKQYYSSAEILANRDLLLLYQRLNDFDNVRPEGALMYFLFATPYLAQKAVWKLLEPVFLLALEQISLDEVVRDKLIRIGDTVGISTRTLSRLLKLRLWRKGMPFWMIKRLLRTFSGSMKLNTQLDMVRKEEVLIPGKSDVQYIVAGHTHYPSVELLDVLDGTQKYYINSGTFRNVVTSTQDLSEFGRLRSKARVLIYEPGERNPEYSTETGLSFDFLARFGYGAQKKSTQAVD